MLIVDSVSVLSTNLISFLSLDVVIVILNDWISLNFEDNKSN